MLLSEIPEQEGLFVFLLQDKKNLALLGQAGLQLSQTSLGSFF